MSRRTARAGTLLPLSWWHDGQAMALTPAARDLYVRLLSWSADELSDGVVPASIVSMLAAADATGPDALAELAATRLVVQESGSLTIPDWETYNLSNLDVQARRLYRAQAGQKGGTERARRRGEGRFARAAGYMTGVGVGETGDGETERRCTPLAVAPAVALATARAKVPA